MINNEKANENIGSFQLEQARKKLPKIYRSIKRRSKRGYDYDIFNSRYYKNDIIRNNLESKGFIVTENRDIFGNWYMMVEW